MATSLIDPQLLCLQATLAWETNPLANIICGRVVLMDSSRAEYLRQLGQRIVSAVDAGAQSFEAICRSCEGAFPSEVKEAIDRLGYSRSILWAAENCSRPKPDYQSILSEPHPLDFDWRFSEETAEKIASDIVNVGDSVACLGTPTLFSALAAMDLSVTLIDRNPYVAALTTTTGKSRVIVDDVARPAAHFGSQSYDVILLDPPWYPEYMRAWLTTAAQLAHAGTVLILTMFRRLVRPPAAHERVKMVKFLETLGTVSALPFQASYDTPLFETETLLNLGLPRMQRWRLGDLMSVKLASPISSLAATLPPEPRWERIRLGTQVVMLKVSTTDSGPITCRSVYRDGSFILKSVSARDPVRRTVNLWTSRNRAMRITGYRRMSSFMRLLESGTTAEEAISVVAKNQGERETLNTIVHLLDFKERREE
jgi:hypothetical protein